MKDRHHAILCWTFSSVHVTYFLFLQIYTSVDAKFDDIGLWYRSCWNRTCRAGLFLILHISNSDYLSRSFKIILLVTLLTNFSFNALVLKFATHSVLLKCASESFTNTALSDVNGVLCIPEHTSNNGSCGITRSRVLYQNDLRSSFQVSCRPLTQLPTKIFQFRDLSRVSCRDSLTYAHDHYNETSGNVFGNLLYPIFHEFCLHRS